VDGPLNSKALVLDIEEMGANVRWETCVADSMNLIDVQHVTENPISDICSSNVIVYARINYSPSKGDLAGL